MEWGKVTDAGFFEVAFLMEIGGVDAHEIFELVFLVAVEI